MGIGRNRSKRRSAEQEERSYKRHEGRNERSEKLINKNLISNFELSRTTKNTNITYYWVSSYINKRIECFNDNITYETDFSWVEDDAVAVETHIY